MILPQIDDAHPLDLDRPATPDELHTFVKTALGFDMPREAVLPDHSAPFDYLCHAFFEDESAPRDCLVWANRGGGKTQIGAIATLLDLLFKPGIQVRILAGSFEQSSKMFAYLRSMLEQPSLAPLVKGRITSRFVQCVNGSRVEVLSQSECAVRGQRVHRLRCDEVELFTPEVWEAAQMITRSGDCSGVYVRGSIEVISTMHRPFGLMQRLVDEAADGNRIIFRWNVVDVLEKCPRERSCSSCALWKDCGGRAKEACGFVAIDDAIVQMKRVGKEVWETEMLCTRPSARDLVYPEFDPSAHVRPLVGTPDEQSGRWLGGMDFGYRSPTVFLWGWLDGKSDVLHIVDEHIATERTVDYHINEVNRRGWPDVEWIGADPAGKARSEQTGTSVIAHWSRVGFRVKTMWLRIEPGVEATRARMRAANGAVRLLVDPRCQGLIRSLQQHHFDPENPDVSHPVKDGPDHACDALRYLVSNLDLRGGAVSRRAY